MISERVTLLKPFGHQHSLLILLNPPNNGLLHAGDCDRFLSSGSEGAVYLLTPNTTMIVVLNCKSNLIHDTNRSKSADNDNAD